MKARNLLFHIQCFKCLLCDKQLNPGDEFGIDRDGFTILCRLHYYSNLQHQQQPPLLNNSNNNEFDVPSFTNSNVKLEPSLFYTKEENISHSNLIPSSCSSYNHGQQQMINHYNINPNDSYSSNIQHLSPLSSLPSINQPTTTATSTTTTTTTVSINNNNNSNNSKGRPKKRKSSTNSEIQPVAKKQTKSAKLVNSENNKSTTNSTNSIIPKINSSQVSTSLLNKHLQQQQQQQPPPQALNSTLNAEALSNNNLLVNQQQSVTQINHSSQLVLVANNGNGSASGSGSSNAESPDDYAKHFDSNLGIYLVIFIYSLIRLVIYNIKHARLSLLKLSYMFSHFILFKKKHHAKGL